MATEEHAKKLEERAKALSDKAAEIRAQCAAKLQLQEARALEKKQKNWGRRPQDTHRKILVGVATLSVLNEMHEPDKSTLAAKLLGQLDERDRATLIQQLPVFQAFKA